MVIIALSGALFTLVGVLVEWKFKVFREGEEKGRREEQLDRYETRIQELEESTQPEEIVREDEFQQFKDQVGNNIENLSINITDLENKVEENTDRMNDIASQQRTDHDIMVKTSQKVDMLDEKVDSMKEDLTAKIDTLSDNVMDLYGPRSGDDN